MMTIREFIHSIIAWFVLTIVLSFSNLLKGNINYLGTALVFSFIILVVAIVAKKLTAFALDSSVEHEIWFWSRYGFKPGWKLDKPAPLGALFPLILTAFSIGIIKCMTLLTYDTTALKRRAARRFGFYSFTEMTDWHNSVIGAGGIVGVLLLAIVSYWIPGLEGLPRFAIFYAFWNMVPVSKLDGTQILAGSKALYTALALIVLVMIIGVFIIV